MAPDRPHVRGSLPWLRSGPLHRIATEALPDLEDFLARHDFEVTRLDGRRMTSRDGAHEELHRAFEFPDWCGNNWDAFNDCFGHFVVDHDGRRVAVIWEHLDVASAAAPASVAEVGWALLECRFGEMPTLPPSNPAAIALEIFAVGDGPDFDAPAV